ncbi:MAG TPA: type II toxin-antitoxin system YafQ family toxin [Planctomycetaceae bacterium]|nr:type II toxin-antitoxin system YafQ family toxin [Planctomycetaceae bacterium]
MRRQLLPSKPFEREVRRHLKKHPGSEGHLQATLRALADDAFQPSLQTHKLKGDLDGYWAASAGYDLRIVFKLIQQGGVEAIVLSAIGTHDDVY